MNFRIPITLITCLASMSALSQRDHEFQIRLGFGAAGYNTVYEQTITFLGYPIYTKVEDGAATAHTPLELRYEFSERFNGGIDFKFGSYLYDPSDSSDSKSNNFTAVGLAGEYALSNKDNFRWYLGAGINTCTLQLNETFNDGSKQQQIWTGGGFRFNTGILKYFGDGPVGFNANFGYDAHNFDLKEMTVDGANVDLSGFSASLDVSGVDLTIGLVLRIR